MEELLEKYLKYYYQVDYIKINDYRIDGSGCCVEYYTDENLHYREDDYINIWDMLVFLNINQNK